MESFRKQDMKAEQALADFMDSYFYSRLKDKKGESVHCDRITDIMVQKDGVDVLIELDNRQLHVDEKATLYYSNLMIPTFAFEIDSIQRGHETPVEGWFINDCLKTDYYMLIWPNVD